MAIAGGRRRRGPAGRSRLGCAMAGHAGGAGGRGDRAAHGAAPHAPAVRDRVGAGRPAVGSRSTRKRSAVLRSARCFGLPRRRTSTSRVCCCSPRSQVTSPRCCATPFARCCLTTMCSSRTGTTVVMFPVRGRVRRRRVRTACDRLSPRDGPRRASRRGVPAGRPGARGDRGDGRGRRSLPAAQSDADGGPDRRTREPHRRQRRSRPATRSNGSSAT